MLLELIAEYVSNIYYKYVKRPQNNVPQKEHVIVIHEEYEAFPV